MASMLRSEPTKVMLSPPVGGAPKIFLASSGWCKLKCLQGMVSASRGNRSTVDLKEMTKE